MSIFPLWVNSNTIALGQGEVKIETERAKKKKEGRGFITRGPLFDLILLRSA